MSNLRVYWPDEGTVSGGVAIDEPAILPFDRVMISRGVIGGVRDESDDVVERARTLFANRSCPCCEYPVVEPLQLDDGLYNRKGRLIPGTATLIGFRCCGCEHRWSPTAG